MHKPRRLLALASFALALVACGDGDKTPIEPVPTGPAPGVLRFSYSGARTGTFSAKGLHTPTAPMAAYAYNFSDEDDDISLIAFQNSTDPNYYDDIAFDIADPQVGTVTCADMNANCRIGFATLFLARAKSGNGFGPSGGFARGTSGWVTITALTQDSIKGSFEMQFSGTSGTFAGQAVQVANGEFNIPRVAF
jgi:hypothetical protein